MLPLIECVPNFSEGRDMTVIKQITDAIEAVEGVKLLDVDPGKATNRTVVTFVGAPEPVIEAAFAAIRTAARLIDMSKHQGEHPRMGATDVCPLIPVAGISMEECVQWARKLAERVGKELEIPVYLYESAAARPERRNLAAIRSGEYEALPDKLTKAEWKPDFGPAKFNARAGAAVIGARDFLIAYNVNLNTTSVRRANSVAFDVREQGRILRDGDPITGPVIKDHDGEPVRQPGMCKAVKAIGWYIEEYGIAQVSMNLTNINQTPLHTAFEACCESANSRGMRVTGSELVGLMPLKVILDAGRHFLKKQQRSVGVSEEEIIKIAVKSMGLDELGPFDPKKKIIEYQLRDAASTRLQDMNLRAFANETAAESPAPGGGSIAAYVGALGASLGVMVANLSSHKRGWDDRWEEFSAWAEKGQEIKDALLRLVDEDTQAFQGIMEAFQLPKGTDAEKAARKQAIQAATKQAIETPYRTMELAFSSFELLEQMVRTGNPNSISDGAVGALCARAAVHGAYLNVTINAKDLDDKAYTAELLRKGKEMAEAADRMEQEIVALARSGM
ncbi:MAG TPA: glutamate formimidoyltransferase [Flavilitoribacter sp.]|nr:glutamate formimidoyltransferase [Flavilitoribacter sp.]HMQ90268.1 glutamate formimidoyltransferase [Flavilitoribacter sp.]